MTWDHAGRAFGYTSTYAVREDSWRHELSGPSGEALAVVVVPDLTPDDGRFTPSPRNEVVLEFSHGSVPWPIWTTFMAAVDRSGDLDR